MKEIDVKDIPIKHYFGGGVAIKQIRVDAGQIIVKHKHDYTHLSYLVSGKIEVIVNEKTSQHDGPDCLTIIGGEYHAIRALTDCVWLCIHATDCEDETQVDQVLVSQDSKYNEMKSLGEKIASLY